MGGYLKENVEVASAVTVIYYKVVFTPEYSGVLRVEKSRKRLEVCAMLDEGGGEGGVNEYLRKKTAEYHYNGKSEFSAGSNGVQESRRRIRNNVSK